MNPERIHRRYSPAFGGADKNACLRGGGEADKNACLRQAGLPHQME